MGRAPSHNLYPLVHTLYVYEHVACPNQASASISQNQRTASDFWGGVVPQKLIYNPRPKNVGLSAGVLNNQGPNFKIITHEFNNSKAPKNIAWRILLRN